MRQIVSKLDRLLAGIVISMACTQAFVIQIIARLAGPNRTARVMGRFFECQQARAGAAAIGIPDMAERANRAMSRMKAQAPESQEWQAFIQNYGATPQPDQVPELFAWMLDAGVLEDRSTELPMAAAVLALADRHNERRDKWEAEYPQVFQSAIAVCLRTGPERAGWNDYYMCRWFVLRDDISVQEIVRRTQQDGDIGATATWMVSSVSNQITEFKLALDRVGYKTPGVDAEFDCGETAIRVGPGPHQITRIPNGGMKRIALPPVNAGETMTPEEEGEILGKLAIVADCGPYKLLSCTPPGPHSNFWVFEITGPGFPPHGVSVVGTDETCGRSIIGGLATAWRAGKIQGQQEYGAPAPGVPLEDLCKSSR